MAKAFGWARILVTTGNSQGFGWSALKQILPGPIATIRPTKDSLAVLPVVHQVALLALPTIRAHRLAGIRLA